MTIRLRFSLAGPFLRRPYESVKHLYKYSVR